MTEELNEQEIRNKLFDFYSEEIPHLQNELKSFSNCNISKPLLIKPCSDYFKSKKRIMIVGQETCGWQSDDDSINSILNSYTDFNLGEDYRSTPFWNDFHYIEKEILGKDNCSAWSNINRVDKNKKKPCAEILEIIEKFDFILKKEIDILSPDILILFTSHVYDYRFKTLYDNLKISPICSDFDEKILAKFEHKDLPSIVVRTYHPSYLRRKKIEEKILSVIINHTHKGE